MPDLDTQLDTIAATFTAEVGASFKRHTDRRPNGMSLVQAGSALISALYALGDILLAQTVELMPPEQAMRVEAFIEQAREEMVAQYQRKGSDA